MISKNTHINFLFYFLFLVFSLNLKAEIKVKSGPPKGFETPEREIIFVDFYYKRQFLKSARIEVLDDEFRILYPSVVYAKLPLVKINKIEALSNYFKASHTFKTEYGCYPDKQEKCDMLNTDLVEFIYNPSNFSVEIVANSNIFLAKEVENVYLTPPSTEFSQFFTFNGVGYLRQEKEGVDYNGFFPSIVDKSKNVEERYNFTLNSKTSLNRFILNSDINFSNQRNSVYANNIHLTRYYRGYNLQIGEFNTEELRAINQANLVGISYRSSVDRRREDVNTFAQPINVYLNYRSRVNLIKDGRIFSSDYYEAGNQSIDTLSLPIGSYNVELEIIEPNGRIRKETQFFVKNGELPPAKKPYFWLQAGLVEKENGRATENTEDMYFNEYNNEFLFRTGIYAKVYKSLGLGTNLIFNENISSGEAFLEYFGRFLSIRGAFGYDTYNNYNYNIYTELININKFVVYASWGQNYLTKEFLKDDEENNFHYKPITSYSKYGTGNIRYYFGNSSSSLNFRGTYSRDQQDIDSYSFGPELEINIPIRPTFFIRTTFSAFKTDLDYQGKINFYFNLNSRNMQLSHNSMYNANRDLDLDNKEINDYYDHSTAITFQGGGVFSQDLRATLRFDDVNNIQTTGGEIDYKTGIGRFNFDAYSNKTFDDYSLNFASIFAFNKNNIIFGGREPKQSAVVIEIDGGNKDSIFDIYVDRNKLDFIKGNSTRVLPLNPFNQYEISLQARDVNNTFVEDNRKRLITLYPGTLRSINLKAKSTVIIIGQLVNNQGQILPKTKIKGEIDEIITDEDGYFQFSAVLGETLTIGNNKKYKVASKIKKKNKNNILFLNEMIAR